MASSFENWSHFPGSYILNILYILNVKHGDTGSYCFSTRCSLFSFRRHLTWLESDYKVFFLESSFHISSPLFFCLFLVDLLGSVSCVHSSRVNQRCGKTELKDPLSGSFPSGIIPLCFCGEHDFPRLSPYPCHKNSFSH